MLVKSCSPVGIGAGLSRASMPSGVGVPHGPDVHVRAVPYPGPSWEKTKWTGAKPSGISTVGNPESQACGQGPFTASAPA